jgi:hypothetical protein
LAREGTPEFYREEARRLRALAASAASPALRHRLLGNAEQLDLMALHAERRRAEETA